MIGELKFPSPEKQGRDVTSEFMQGTREFAAFYNAESLQNEPHLEIHVDLTNITDRHEFIGLARRAKAFAEKGTVDQERDASIRCTVEQKQWEYNVFSSGVQWEKAE